MMYPIPSSSISTPYEWIDVVNIMAIEAWVLQDMISSTYLNKELNDTYIRKSVDIRGSNVIREWYQYIGYESFMLKTINDVGTELKTNRILT